MNTLEERKVEPILTLNEIKQPLSLEELKQRYVEVCQPSEFQAQRNTELTQFYVAHFEQILSKITHGLSQLKQAYDAGFPTSERDDLRVVLNQLDNYCQLVGAYFEVEPSWVYELIEKEPEIFVWWSNYRRTLLPEAEEALFLIATESLSTKDILFHLLQSEKNIDQWLAQVISDNTTQQSELYFQILLLRNTIDRNAINYWQQEGILSEEQISPYLLEWENYELKEWLTAHREEHLFHFLLHLKEPKIWLKEYANTYSDQEQIQRYLWMFEFPEKTLNIEWESAPKLFMVMGKADSFILPYLGEIADITDRKKQQDWFQAFQRVYTHTGPDLDSILSFIPDEKEWYNHINMLNSCLEGLQYEQEANSHNSAPYDSHDSGDKNSSDKKVTRDIEHILQDPTMDVFTRIFFWEKQQLESQIAVHWHPFLPCHQQELLITQAINKVANNGVAYGSMETK